MKTVGEEPGAGVAEFRGPGDQKQYATLDFGVVNYGIVAYGIVEYGLVEYGIV